MRSRSPWDPKVAMSCSTNPLGRPGSARTGLRSPRRSSSPTGSRTWAVGVLELGDHFLRVGHEVWADVTAIKLQALHDVELGCQGFGFLDRYHPLVANPLHRLRHHPADPDIAIGADRRDLRDLLTGRDLPRPLAHIVDDHTHGHIDAALQIHRVHPGDHCLGTVMGDRLSQNRRGGGAVAGELACLNGNLSEHLRAHVLEPVGELDLLGDRNPVLADPGRPKGFVEQDIATFGSQGDLDRIRKSVDPAEHLLACGAAEANFLCSHRSILRQAAFARTCASSSMTPKISDSFRISRSSPLISTSVPAHLPNSTRSPTLTSSGRSVPVSSRAPGPTASTSPSTGFSFAVSGMMIPPGVFSSASIRRTRMRSCRGLKWAMVRFLWNGDYGNWRLALAALH